MIPTKKNEIQNQEKRVGHGTDLTEGKMRPEREIQEELHP
jgi:hypothetical protein